MHVVADRSAIKLLEQRRGESRLWGADEIEATRAVLADVGAPSLHLRLLEPTHVPARVADKMRAFKHGFGTFKMDWALSALADC